MVFKKDLTPIGPRGAVVKHRGKGSTVQRLPPGGRETITGGSPLNQMTGRFPKPAPAPVAPPMGPPAGPPGPAPGPPGLTPGFARGGSVRRHK
jgi:hypothetical protein